MRITKVFFLTVAAFAWAGIFPATGRAETRVDTLQFTSRILAHNPLSDPATRSIAVFVPSQATNGTPLPVVYYLPGFGSSPESVLKKSAAWQAAVDKIASNATPVIVVIPDGRNRWGGSQYINSPAQGNYADYICDEIVPFIESHYRVAAGNSNRIIAGHSSGGYGALRLGMMRPGLFGGVIALSPDSDFNLSHLPLVKIPGVTNVALKEIRSLMNASAGATPPKDGDLRYALALSAAYAPGGLWHRGEFEWLYDENGRWRDSVWSKWLANDPLTLATKQRQPFKRWQKIYLEGTAQDEYKANVGAKKIYDALTARRVNCTFYEPPGHHSDHTADRLQRGLAWYFNKPMQEIPDNLRK